MQILINHDLDTWVTGGCIYVDLRSILKIRVARQFHKNPFHLSRIMTPKVLPLITRFKKGLMNSYDVDKQDCK